jgi:hypothetical protein
VPNAHESEGAGKAPKQAGALSAEKARQKPGAGRALGVSALVSTRHPWRKNGVDSRSKPLPLLALLGTATTCWENALASIRTPSHTLTRSHALINSNKISVFDILALGVFLQFC